MADIIKKIKDIGSTTQQGNGRVADSYGNVWENMPTGVGTPQYDTSTYKLISEGKNDKSNPYYTGSTAEAGAGGGDASGNNYAAEARRYTEGLDTTKMTPEEEAATREDIRKQFQAQIDAVNSYYDNLKSTETAAGIARKKQALGMETATNARSGLSGSTFGNAAVERTTIAQDETNSANLKKIEGERNIKVQSILTQIDQRAEDKITNANNAALQNEGTKLTYLKQVQDDATKNITDLAKTGKWSLSAFQATDYYKQLQEESGMPSWQLDLTYDQNSPQPQIISTSMTATDDGKTKITMFKQDGTGKIIADTQIVDVPLPKNTDYKPQFAPDGTLFFMPDKIDPNIPLKDQIVQYGSQGQFSKPSSESNPTSFKEWELAGGEKGTGKTYGEWLTDEKKKQSEQVYLNDDSNTSIAHALVKAYKTADEAKKSLDVGQLTINGSLVKISNEQAQAIKDKIDIEYPSGKRTFWNAVLPGGK